MRALSIYKYFTFRKICMHMYSKYIWVSNMFNGNTVLFDLPLDSTGFKIIGELDFTANLFFLSFTCIQKIEGAPVHFKWKMQV